MALIWCEGFDDLVSGDIHTSGIAYEGRWDSFNSYGTGRWSIETGTRTGNGKELYCSSTPYAAQFIKDMSGQTTVIVGMAIKCETLLSDGGLVHFRDDNTGAQMVGFRVGGNGLVLADKDTSGWGNSHLCSSTKTLPIGAWAYLEIKVFFSDTVGTIDFRINGENAGSFTGLDTTAGVTTCGQVRFLMGDGTDQPAIYPARIDDIYIADTTGSVNNDFLGPIEIVTIMPDGDGSTNAWTPSTGTVNADLVDEIPANGDTDYVSTATTTNQDLYTYANLDGNTNTVKAVQVSARVRNEGAGSETLKLLARSGTTTGASAAHGFDTTYLTVQDVFEVNPDTSTAWTETTVNGAEFGIELA